jgi:hypothetical protein
MKISERLIRKIGASCVLSAIIWFGGWILWDALAFYQETKSSLYTNVLYLGICLLWLCMFLGFGLRKKRKNAVSQTDCSKNPKSPVRSNRKDPFRVFKKTKKEAK